MKPAALSKAESLAAHARYLGVRPSEFMVSLTLGEAYELLDHLAAEHPTNRVLLEDIAAAKTAADPWIVLANFQLQGLEIGRVNELH